MSKNKVIILSVVHQKMPVSEVARSFGVSASWVHRLVKRYNKEGNPAFEQGSKAPISHPHAISAEIQAEILVLRQQLDS
jgi:transposase